jgi:hypothetical protein
MITHIEGAMQSAIKLLVFALSIVAASLVYIDIIGQNSRRNFESVMRDLRQVPVAEPTPEPRPNLEPELDRLASSIARVAIEASLIPYNLFDSDQTERRIRGHLENQLGDDWTIEVTCYAGWCNITLDHAIGEIVIDADEGSATKSVYLGSRGEPSAEEATALMNAIAENLKAIAIVASKVDEAQAAKIRAELEHKFAGLGSTLETLHEPDFCSITLKTQGGTIHAWALNGEGHTHVSAE